MQPRKLVGLLALVMFACSTEPSGGVGGGPGGSGGSGGSSGGSGGSLGGGSGGSGGSLGGGSGGSLGGGSGGSSGGSGGSSAHPVARFTVTPPGGTAPAPIDFDGSASTATGSIVSYAWDFGDGTALPGAQPQVTHTYAAAGHFTAKLTVTDDLGLTDTQQLPVLINGAPVAIISASATSGAAPLTVTFDGSASTDDGTLTAYTWSFGDGATASGAQVTHTFSTAGSFTAELTVTDDLSAQATADTSITVFGAADYRVPQTANPPTIDGILNEWAAVPGITISDSDYDGLGTPNSLTFKLMWDAANLYAAFDVTDAQLWANAMADEVSLYEDDGIELYLDTGTRGGTFMQRGDYQLNVTARGFKQDLEGTGTSKDATFTLAGLVKAAVASGTLNVNDVDTGYRVEVKIPWAAISVVPAVGTRLGANVGSYDCEEATCDGAPNGRQSFAWANDGTFSIPDRWKTLELGPLVAMNAAPIARVTADRTSGNAPLMVTFDGSTSTDSDGTLTSYAWSFGDGTTRAPSTSPTATHTYATPGTFRAVLTVTDDDGAVSTAELSISINAPPSASLSANRVNGTAPLTVTFDSSGSRDSDGTIASRSLDFGDGSARSTSVMASHTYATAGTYTATITVTDDDGATDTEQVQITVTAAMSSYHLFNPADYAASATYDPTGALESTPSFQRAIDDASTYATQHASAPAQYGLFVPPPMKNAANINVGPDAPQAIVQVDAYGVFKLDSVLMKPNVRLEIHASSTLIPIEAFNTVNLYLSQPTSTNTNYISNVTVTAWGASTTFRDTGRRCSAAGKPSPCNLPKTVKYPATTFLDGTGFDTPDPTALAYRYTIDRDVRRYPNADKSVGNTPRGAGLKARQVKNFLVEKMLELAYPGEVLNPDDTPPGPGAIGSNTYPATSGNGLGIDAVVTPSGGTPDYREEAVQARNGTIRYLHCENCTRGYGIIEIHAGVDLEYHHISTRGGVAIRWENLGNGRAVRQTVTQIAGYDCSVPVVMSTHENNTSGLGVPGPEQDTLRATFVKAVGCERGFRSNTAGGTNVNSSASDVYIYAGGVDGDPGGRAQVILCRGGTDCARYGAPLFDDEAWMWKPSQKAIDNVISIPLARMYCRPSDFVVANTNGTCSPFPP